MELIVLGIMLLCGASIKALGITAISLGSFQLTMTALKYVTKSKMQD